MNGGIKENANPTILDVDNFPSRNRNISQIWTLFNRLKGEAKNDEIFHSTSHIQSTLYALNDVSDATGGQAVELLVNSGLILRRTSDHTTLGKSNSYYPIQLSPYERDVERFPPEESNRLDHEKIDEDEVFDIIRNIQDPEHPLTLEQLGVISRQQVEVKNDSFNGTFSIVDVRFTPTIPHCSMATLIGLSIRVKLLRSLPGNDRFKVIVRIEPGTHNSEMAVNKQLADKERVCAALENKHLLGMVNKCIASGMKLK